MDHVVHRSRPLSPFRESKTDPRMSSPVLRGIAGTAFERARRMRDHESSCSLRCPTKPPVALRLLCSPRAPGRATLGQGNRTLLFWYSFTGVTAVGAGLRRCAPSRGRGRSLEGVGDNRFRSSKHRGDEWGKVELTLLGSAHDAGEDLLRVGPVTGAIATAHLAGYDRGADGLFGAPVGRIYRRVPEKGEQGGELGGQMVGEALCGDQSRWRVDQPCEFGEKSVAGSDQLVVGQAPGVASVSQFQRVLQDHLHIASPRAAGMVVLDFPAASEQVRQTALMARGVEAAIHHPPRRARARRRSRLPGR